MEEIGFSIDAGLISRLGIELVGKAETAVSELIKNAYDADANLVTLNFKDTKSEGGTLVIDDDGSGMTKDQLLTGFMRISSADKINNPISPRYKRSRAGRKGIGRFATQRLGRKLTLITQTVADKYAQKITIDWEKYESSKELNSISHPIETIEKQKEYGTTLIIEQLRESWSEAAIKRVFRYTSELIQPNYLSEGAAELGLATEEENDSFEIKFFQTVGSVTKTVADIEKMLFDFAIATIESHVGNDKVGHCRILSKRFQLDEQFDIFHNDNNPYRLISNIYFKASYFIYNRPDYYDNSIPKMLLNQIQEFAADRSGIRLYRNGFRVLPYGEANDDWLGLDKRWSAEFASINIPFANRNLFGFVQVIDRKGELFEETASREGLIENEALVELKEFLQKSLLKARQTISASIEFKKARETFVKKNRDKKDLKEKIEELDHNIQKLGSDLKKRLLHENVSANSEQRLLLAKAISTFEETVADLANKTASIADNVKETIEELAMMRVLAGLGISIGEFVHELQQFTPSFQGNLVYLSHQALSKKIKEVVSDMQRSFQRFKSYSSYFDKTISRNVQRELEVVNLKKAVNEFINTIKADAQTRNILVLKEFKGIDLYTCPMHPSEWGSILFNFYTNSKKAIIRAKSAGRILIALSANEDNVILQFQDNGDGVKDEHEEKIFVAFFTTSRINLNASSNDYSGTGLGLKIVKDIIEAYKGRISLVAPRDDFATCFQVEIPKATKEQISKQ